MKNALIFFILLLSFNCYSQINKGTWLLGGNISGGSSGNNIKTAYSSQNNFSRGTSLSAGYFIASNFAVGINPGTASQSSSTNINGHLYKFQAYDYNLSLFARKYFTLNEKWNFFIQANIGPKYSRINTTNNFADTLDRAGSNVGYMNRGISLSILPGVTYFLSPKMALETSINFLQLQALKQTNDSPFVNTPAPTWQYSAISNIFNINIGLVFYPGRKSNPKN